MSPNFFNRPPPRRSAPRPSTGCSPLWTLYRVQAEAVHTMRCYGFGPRSLLDIYPTGATLSYAVYAVSGTAANLAVQGPTLMPYDMGGACFTADGSGEIVAIIKS